MGTLILRTYLRRLPHKFALLFGDAKALYH
jgi:hypothetical protein